MQTEYWEFYASPLKYFIIGMPSFTGSNFLRKTRALHVVPMLGCLGPSFCLKVLVKRGITLRI